MVMNLIDYVYYNVYRWYDEMKRSGRKVDPASLSSTVFGMSFGGLCLLIFWFYSYITHKEWPDLGWIFIVAFSFLVSWIIDWIYSSRNRLFKVLEYYRDKNIKRSNIALVFICLFSPFIIYVICIIIFKDS